MSDLENARVKLRDRKGDDDHIIPLLPEDAAMLAGRLGRARAAGLDTVWFKERRTKGPGAKVYLRALTAGGGAMAMRRAMVRTGLKASKGMRGMHDLRHHSGMQILRQTGNLRLAQRLLGHADIKSTMVYAHAIEADVKAGLAGLSRNSPEPAGDDDLKAVADHPAKASGAAGS